MNVRIKFRSRFEKRSLAIFHIDNNLRLLFSIRTDLRTFQSQRMNSLRSLRFYDRKITKAAIKLAFIKLDMRHSNNHPTLNKHLLRTFLSYHIRQFYHFERSRLSRSVLIVHTNVCPNADV
ncbi:hypothetical protein THF1D04_20329 [Vibrio owensii]|uniref:Uncharacterized protein n=1 Tax=Vibrio owensii TaxID=696485 RepID=A0AAU9Q3W2_9VIBR|nr:hypothetical protein THF1D04_20329 [Vibrio owensii]